MKYHDMESAPQYFMKWEEDTLQDGMWCLILVLKANTKCLWRVREALNCEQWWPLCLRFNRCAFTFSQVKWR